MRGAGARSWVLIATIAIGASATAGMVEEAAERESLRLCHEADRLDGAARADRLAEALSMAEQAVRLHPDHPDAHFAVFCALGKQVNDRGLGFGSFGDVRRLRQAIDRTLELDPDHVDGLVAKASMLFRLPRIFGGDPEEAARCVERAHRNGPDHPVAAAMWRDVAAKGGGVGPH